MRLVAFPPLVQGCNTCRARAEVITTALFLGETEIAESGQCALADHLWDEHEIEPSITSRYVVRAGEVVVDDEGEWMLVRRAP
ncbi:hypothetical protein [Streptomyces caatingaensis]|uniref:Uncharacterized protein n=1 Tax=Streptomyces caatingaensis TaxID=1678637 RepID=A0A0K9XIK3_9ACTN|nr:hypothetical protein [Streptomyces caatingaensis]KNB52886.1 hypothetical protein AC230_09655 [Streptomyces caatingaensis]